VAQALLVAAKRPLAAPSANRFGRISPTTAAHVVQELGDRIGIVLDGGASTVGVESTVVAIAMDGTLTLLRPGGVSVEAIEATASVRLARTPVDSAPGVPAASPGMSGTHYAPRTPLHLLPGPETLPPGAACVGLIGVFASKAEAASVVDELERRYRIPVVLRALTDCSDLEEAARNLFTSLRELDAGDVPLILAVPPGGNEGLALAIADRLRRASR
jgi:L-threonylcarbamoyladenylate synthase